MPAKWRGEFFRQLGDVLEVLPERLPATGISVVAVGIAMHGASF